MDKTKNFCFVQGIRIDAAAFDAIEERRTATQDSIIDNDILPCIPEVKDQLGAHYSIYRLLLLFP